MSDVMGCLRYLFLLTNITLQLSGFVFASFLYWSSWFASPDRTFLYNCSRLFGRPFVQRFTLFYRPLSCVSCLSCQPPPQLSAHVCCGQMARWIQMPLGREVSLGPGVIVLDGDPAPPKLWPNSHASQQLLSFCAGWMLLGQHWQDTRSNHPLASSFVDLLMKS